MTVAQPGPDEAQTESSETSPDMLEAALGYEKHGLHVFPLIPGTKDPATTNGFYDASCDPAVIRAMWRGRPGCNVAIRSGPLSGIIVIDVDNKPARNDKPAKVGEATFKALIEQLGPLPITPEALSGDNGRHLFFKHPGVPIQTKSDRLGKHVDVIGDTGYVVAAPSIHPDTGLDYKLAPGRAFGDVELAELPPTWLAYLLAKQAKPEPERKAANNNAYAPPGGVNPRWAKAALENELATLRAAVEGSRNSTLNSCSFSLGQLVGGGFLDEPHVVSELFRVAISIGLERGESLKTIHSGLSAGMKAPRPAPESSSTNGAYHSGGTNGAGPAVSSESWPDPTPLPELPPVPQWNDMLLPKVLRAWVADAAESMQAPPEFIAATAVVVASSLIGTTVAMRPRALGDWSAAVNLWGVIIGAPATKKSPSKDEACRPFASIIKADENAALAELGSRMFDASRTEAEMSTLKDRLKVLAKNGKHDEAEALRERFVELQGQLNAGQGGRRYQTSQCTPEALIKLLNQNPRGLLLNRDELAGWLAALDRLDHAADRKFFMECWNGYGTYDHDTQGKGWIHCESTCLSVIGCMTPGSLAGYMRAAMRGGSGADGMMQRFQLAVFPDRRVRKRVDRPPNRDAYKAALQAFTRLASLQPVDVRAQQLDDGRQPFLRFDSAAQAEWNTWEDALNARVDQGELPEAFESHVNKYGSLAASLALIFHLLDDPTGGPVRLEALERALAWVQVLEAHAVRIYASASVGDDGTVRTLWKRITSGRLGASFTVRTLKKSDWSGLTTDEAVEDALRRLVDLGWIRLAEEHSPNGGRPSRKVLVHPAVVAKWGRDD